MKNPFRKIENIALQQAVREYSQIESDIIPSSLWLGGLKIDVVYDDTLVKIKQLIGEAKYSEQKIFLDPSVAPLQTLEQSYIHELVHWILYMMGENELRSNERIVDLFAHFLYQARVTARFHADMSSSQEED